MCVGGGGGATLPEVSDARDVFLTRHSVNFPRTRRLLKCMEQSAFLFNLHVNQERIEMTKIVKHIISYALKMKQKISWSICGFHGPKTTRPQTPVEI